MNNRSQDSLNSEDVSSERTIERRLLDYYNHAEQPGADIWSRVAPALAGLRATQDAIETPADPSDMSLPAGRTWPGSRLARWLRVPQKVSRGGIIAAGLLVAILLAGGTYAAAPLLGRVLLHDPGAQQAANTNLGRRVNIVRSVGGYSMTVLWVYADANRAIVGYRIAGPAGHTFKEFDLIGLGLPDPALTDANGRSLPWRGGESPDLWPGSAEELIYFDAAAITDQPSELRLHLVVPQITVIEDTHGARYDNFVVSGPWVFDFTVPFHAGRTLEPHQAVTNNGHIFTLDRAVLTPSETRLYFHGMPAAVEYYWAVLVSISVAGSGRQWLGPPSGAGGSGEHYEITADGQMVWNTPTPLIDKHGRWTVTLTFQPMHGPGEPPPKPVVTGPVAFQFDVP